LSCAKNKAQEFWIRKKNTSEQIYQFLGEKMNKASLLRNLKKAKTEIEKFVREKNLTVIKHQVKDLVDEAKQDLNDLVDKDLNIVIDKFNQQLKKLEANIDKSFKEELVKVKSFINEKKSEILELQQKMEDLAKEKMSTVKKSPVKKASKSKKKAKKVVKKTKTAPKKKTVTKKKTTKKKTVARKKSKVTKVAKATKKKVAKSTRKTAKKKTGTKRK
jgi:arsenate reductase-like glutaredoxin family protein